MYLSFCASSACFTFATQVFICSSMLRRDDCHADVSVLLRSNVSRAECVSLSGGEDRCLNSANCKGGMEIRALRGGETEAKSCPLGGVEGGVGGVRRPTRSS